MIYKIEVFNKENFPDVYGNGLKKDVFDLGITSIKDARVEFLFLIEGDLSEQEIKRICDELLCDPVTQEYRYDLINTARLSTSDGAASSSFAGRAEVLFKPGVTDNVGESTKIGIRDLGIKNVKSVKTGTKYIFSGINKQEVKKICEKLLANKVVQKFDVSG